MEDLYIIFKGVLDPIFIVFFLLLLSLFISVIKNKKRSGSLILLFSVILLYGASIAPVANYFCYYLERDYINSPLAGDKSIDVIVVLGNGVKDINALKNTFPTERTSARVLHAVEVYNKSTAKYFVCSGKGTGKISEAAVMARLAQNLGVPGEKIKMEDKSANTWQNAAELNKMFANKNISIGIVTSAYHMKRSEREFKKYFNNVFALPANYFYSSRGGDFIVKYMPQSEELYKTSLALKEIVSQLWYSVKSVTQ
jgi:uncharacterized SAM-binding protein YcdF (DUF218 family)